MPRVSWGSNTLRCRRPYDGRSSGHAPRALSKLVSWGAALGHPPPEATRVGGDDVSREDETRIAAEQEAAHLHQARPEQTEEDFAEGQEQLPHPPESEPDPNFARGQSAEPPEGGLQGRFSEGQEELGEEDPEKHVERRFSEGQEISPDSDCRRGPPRRAVRRRSRPGSGSRAAVRAGPRRA